MSIQIRHSVFETNSSSSHSLTMGKGSLVAQPFTTAQLRAGVVDLHVGNYNWEWRRYYGAEAKLKYLLTQITDGQIDEGYSDTLTDALCEANPHVAMMCDVVRAFTGCELKIHAGSGSIDHQSAAIEKGVGLELFASPHMLRDFVFDPHSCIQTGNDNSAMPMWIDTDRGREHAFASELRDPPTEYVSIELASLSRHGNDGFSMATGGVVRDAGVTAPLYASLVSSGIVEFAQWNAAGSHNHFRHEDLNGYSARAVKETGFKLSPRFASNLKFVESQTEDEEAVTFTVLVPTEVLETLRALPADGLAQYKLQEATKQHRFWSGRLVESKTPDRWATQRVEAHAKEVAKWTKELARVRRLMKGSKAIGAASSDATGLPKTKRAVA